MTTDLHSLIAPYALDALDSDERSRFEAHLDQCATCQSELMGFQVTASRLGEETLLTPPADLRDRLMSAVSTTPQERPVTSLAQRRGLRRTLPRLAMAAAFLIGTVGAGGFVVERQRAHDALSASETISAVLSSADADTTSTSFPAGGNVRLISSADKDAAVIFANNLPSPGKGKVYQVWMITGSKPASQGTFESDGRMIMKGVGDADRVAVTIEPEGGSKHPTTPPVTSLAV